MKKTFVISLFLGVSALLSSCEKHQEVYFDTPFVTISDENRISSSQNIDKNANNLLTELWVDMVISEAKFTEDITVEYDLSIGDGLKEGVDFVIQGSTLSPLIFKKGKTSLPIRILWKKAPFNPEKDNSLTITLVSSSLEEMVIGYPGPSAIRSKFTFTKY